MVARLLTGIIALALTVYCFIASFVLNRLGYQKSIWVSVMVCATAFFMIALPCIVTSALDIQAGHEVLPTYPYAGLNIPVRTFRDRLVLKDQICELLEKNISYYRGSQNWNNGSLYTGATVGHGLSGCTNRSICTKEAKKSRVVAVIKYCSNIKVEASNGDKASSIVIHGKCPNLLLQYKFIPTTSRSPVKINYLLSWYKPDAIVMEFATGGSLASVAGTKPAPKVMCTLMLQVLMGLLGLKLAGMCYHDSHWANQFVLKVDASDSEVWHYRLLEKDIYLPNVGFIACVADYGGAAPYTPAGEKLSISRFFKYNHFVNTFKNFKQNYSKDFVTLMEAAHSQTTLVACINTIVSGANTISLDFLNATGMTMINSSAYLTDVTS